MFCVRCGATLSEGAAFCASCGTPVAASGGEPGASAPPPPAITAPWTAVAAGPFADRVVPDYGGFWRRFWSYLLDRFILGVVMLPVGLVVLMPLMATESLGWTDTDLPEAAIRSLMGAILVVAGIGLLGSWLYYALMQSSSKQATLGQLALGIRVTDLEGRRISFARASGRYFATMLTGLTFGIGYLLMLFTARKQTLHDLVAGTLVLR
jgi:uncharacterized RDD family membrane protein YckC